MLLTLWRGAYCEGWEKSLFEPLHVNHGNFRDLVFVQTPEPSSLTSSLTVDEAQPTPRGGGAKAPVQFSHVLQKDCFLVFRFVETQYPVTNVFDLYTHSVQVIV